MDEYLDSLGLYRKHVAKDGSCLFRVVSEQVFQTQHYHLMVRTACINYLEKNRSKYEEFIEGSFEQYLENLKNPKEWAGHVEINAMSILFKRDFLVYQEVGKPPVRVTNNDYPDFITSCYSHSNHYDCVYPKAFLGAAAICQSLVYEVLYKRVFKLGDEVDIAVKKMLHDKIYSKQRKNSFLCRDSHRESTSSKEDSSEGVEEEQVSDASAEIRKALAQGVPPFPYKVAKALDPEIYRNVEFDLWNESRKEQLRFEQMIIPDFAPGVKCLVRIEKDQTEPYHAHIQEMSQNQGPVIVYIEELGQKCAVPYENLEALPIPAYKVFPWQGSGNKSYRMLSEYLRSSLQGKLKGRSKQPKKPSSKDMSLVIPFPTGLSPPSIQFTTAQTFPIQGSPSKPFPIPSVSSYHMQPDEGAVLTHSQIASGKFPEGHVPVVCLPNVQMAGSPSELSSVTSLWGCGSSYGKVPAPMKMAEHYAESKDQCEKNDSFTSEILLEHDSKTNCFSCCTSLGQDINRYLDESDTNSSCSPVFSNSPNHPVTLLQSSEETVPHAVSPSSHPLHSSISAVNQPVTVYPCPVYSGMLLPYGESVSVNLNAWRSQDPTGSDLPLADLPTVRFFYNLGCDYFRMTSMIPVASPSPYSTWTACNGGVSYAVGTPCSSVPITGSDDQRAVGTSGTYINTGSQLYPAQPVMVGSPPPSISAHAVFYPSALQTSVHHPSPAPSSHVSPCVTSLP